jgi:hypothetical protein
VGKKDSAGAVGADQRFFFSKMRAAAGYPGRFGGIANSRFSGQPINAAFPRAKRAGLQEVAGPGCFFLEPTFFISSDIRRFLYSHIIPPQNKVILMPISSCLL